MQHQVTVTVMVMGALVISALLLKSLSRLIKIPALVFFIILGAGINILAPYIQGFSIKPDAENIFIFLADLGIIVLLFKIGLDSNLKKMIQNLTRAGFVGITALLFSVAAGYVSARYILNLPVLASASVAAALSATSVGIPASIWADRRKIDTKAGQLFVDMAEFDDIAGVILMAMLFAVLDNASGSENALGFSAAAVHFLKLLGKLLLFMLACVLFSHYAEKPLRKKLSQLEKPPDLTIVVIAAGIIIASVAGLMGFSLAIGAFFAGLIFSRDPDSVKDQTAFDVLYDLFTPFFFIHVGLNIEPGAGAGIIVPSLVILTAAVLGKYIGTFLPAVLISDKKTSAVLAVSMIPRAEITLIIAQAVAAKNIIDRNIYAGLVITSLLTCLVPPAVLKHQLKGIEKDKNN